MTRSRKTSLLLRGGVNNSSSALLARVFSFRHELSFLFLRARNRQGSSAFAAAVLTIGLSSSVLIVATFVSTGHAQRKAHTADVPFTPDGIASLKGKDVCELKGDFHSKLGVYLDGRKDHAVRYRERDGMTVLFLLGKPLCGNCGIVQAALDLTPLLKTGESVEFKCQTDTEGGTTWEKWGHVIGLAENQRGRKRFVDPRLAWRVNIPELRFDPIRTKTAHCDTTGYED